MIERIDKACQIAPALLDDQRAAFGMMYLALALGGAMERGLELPC